MELQDRIEITAEEYQNALNRDVEMRLIDAESAIRTEGRRKGYKEGFIAGKEAGYRKAMMKIFERALKELGGDYGVYDE